MIKKDENGKPLPKEVDLQGKVDIIQTYPNQKIITVFKEVCDDQHIYTKTNIQVTLAASRVLKSGAFRLWIYFSLNRDKFSFALSSSKVEKDLGISKKQYDNGMKELIDKGFIVLNDENKNWYFFTERQNKKIDIEKNDEEVPCTQKLPSLYLKDTTRSSQRIQEILHNTTSITNTVQSSEPCDIGDSLPSNVVDFGTAELQEPTPENQSTDDELNLDDLTIPQDIIDQLPFNS